MSWRKFETITGRYYDFAAISKLAGLHLSVHKTHDAYILSSGLIPHQQRYLDFVVLILSSNTWVYLVATLFALSFCSGRFAPLGSHPNPKTFLHCDVSLHHAQTGVKFPKNEKCYYHLIWVNVQNVCELCWCLIFDCLWTLQKLISVCAQSLLTIKSISVLLFWLIFG